MFMNRAISPAGNGPASCLLTTRAISARSLVNRRFEEGTRETHPDDADGNALRFTGGLVLGFGSR